MKHILGIGFEYSLSGSKTDKVVVTGMSRTHVHMTVGGNPIKLTLAEAEQMFNVDGGRQPALA